MKEEKEKEWRGLGKKGMERTGISEKGNQNLKYNKGARKDWK